MFFDRLRKKILSIVKIQIMLYGPPFGSFFFFSLILIYLSNGIIFVVHRLDF